MNFDDYVNKETFPIKANYTVHFPVVFKTQVKVIDFFDEEEFNKIKKRYYAEDKRIHEKFKNDLFDELGIQNNPKKDVLYDLAWEYGHSSGFSDVYNYACDFVCLIK